MGIRFDPETYEVLGARARPDQPLAGQYLSYLGNALTRHLGFSFRTNRPVTESLLSRR